MSDTKTIRRYRVETSVRTKNCDWVNLTSVIDARLDLCENEIQIGTYAIEHFKQMMADELKELKKGTTTYHILKQAIKRVKEDEKSPYTVSCLHVHMSISDQDEEGYSYEDQEVAADEVNPRFQINPFKNEVSCLVEYKIS